MILDKITSIEFQVIVITVVLEQQKSTDRFDKNYEMIQKSCFFLIINQMLIKQIHVPKYMNIFYKSQNGLTPLNSFSILKNRVHR